MPNAKYERRVAEAQALMSKPPHSIVVWGNVILMGLIICFLLLSKFVTITRTATLPCHVDRWVSMDNGDILFATDSNVPNGLDTAHRINFTPNADIHMGSGGLSGHLDTVWNDANGYKILITLQGGPSAGTFTKLQPGMGGNIEFELRRISFLSLLSQRRP